MSNSIASIKLRADDELTAGVSFASLRREVVARPFFVCIADALGDVSAIYAGTSDILRDAIDSVASKYLRHWTIRKLLSGNDEDAN